MCIGEPMQVLACDGATARCMDRHGQRRDVDLLLVGPQPEGAWVLVFLDVARELIDEARAACVRDALDAVGAVMRGEAADVDAAFGDLVGREPQLPDFLKGA